MTVEPYVQLRGNEVEVGGDANVTVALFYPSYDLGKSGAVDLTLYAVRAADDIRVKYDFDRDGWVIFQQKGVEHFSWSDTEPGWHEAAFVKAWGQYTECSHHDEECPKCPMEDDG